MKLQLSPIFSFAIGPYKERLRLIVFKNEKEYVCRKENRKNLAAFLLCETGQLFKGRLQLLKRADEIIVQVKGEAIGEIKKLDFEKMIGN
jgi:hypothetical protein